MDKFLEYSKNGDFEAVNRILKRYEEQGGYKEDLLSLQDQEGNTALHLSAAGGFYDICELFVNDGAIIDISNLKKETPLLLAAKNGYTKISLFLIDHGAIIDVQVLLIYLRCFIY